MEGLIFGILRYLLRSKFFQEKCLVIFICGNLFLRITVIIANITKIRTRKNSVPHGITLLNFSPFNLPLLSSPAHQHHLLLTAGELASLE